MVTASVNPLSPKSDQHQISLCNINVLLNRAVVRITDTITQNEFAWCFINFSTTTVGNEQGRQKRIHILILGFKGLRDPLSLAFNVLSPWFFKYSRRHSRFIFIPVWPFYCTCNERNKICVTKKQKKEKAKVKKCMTNRGKRFVLWTRKAYPGFQKVISFFLCFAGIK